MMGVVSDLGGGGHHPATCLSYSTSSPTSCWMPVRCARLHVTHRVDVLVVGGGCVGAGVALDAATRGLKVRRCTLPPHSPALLHAWAQPLCGHAWTLVPPCSDDIVTVGCDCRACRGALPPSLPASLPSALGGSCGARRLCLRHLLPLHQAGAWRHPVRCLALPVAPPHPCASTCAPASCPLHPIHALLAMELLPSSAPPPHTHVALIWFALL